MTVSATDCRTRLLQKARLIKSIRAFFYALDFIEVDTPLLSPSTNTDVQIQSITARVNGQRQYLQTSPEFAMKKLLSQGSGSIFQIAHAFRDEEQGRWHHPEFTLLEWYSVGFDYRQLMKQVQQLIASLACSTAQWQFWSYREVFQSVLRIDPLHAEDAQLTDVLLKHAPDTDCSAWSRQDKLDYLMSEVVSQNFSEFTFIYDYPAEQASLARLSTDDVPVAERFELFYGPIELANGFSELTDATEQKLRFEQDLALRKAQGKALYPIDEALIAALESGLPECAGVALGLERLMAVLDQQDGISAHIN